MKFYGPIGYGISQETSDGVWEDTVTEYSYYGDVVSITREQNNSQDVNPDITTGNSISIVADEFARGHFFAIRYVEWMNTRWIVKKVDVQGPRLLLRLGGVYNGNTA